MSRRFAVRIPLELAYRREAMFAVELLDAVTLERVTQGVDVTARGIAGKPVVNHSGLFVWVRQDASKFDRLLIEPRDAPFERVDLPAAQVNRPLHTIQLYPLASYPFAPGITAIRGRLVESDSMAPQVPRVAIAGATVTIEWLDDNGVTWHPWQAPRVTTATGDFTAMVRLARGQAHADGSPEKPDEPKLDANGDLSIRFTAKRANGTQKQNTYPLAQGRVTDKTFAWGDLL
jgi:hypothetical protein